MWSSLWNADGRNMEQSGPGQSSEACTDALDFYFALYWNPSGELYNGELGRIFQQFCRINGLQYPRSPFCIHAAFTMALKSTEMKSTLQKRMKLLGWKTAHADITSKYALQCVCNSRQQYSSPCSSSPFCNCVIASFRLRFLLWQV